MQENKKILIILPAFNEEKNIKKAITDVCGLSLNADIAVIDDGSFDKTSACARQEGVDVISVIFNLGIGGALQTGFKYAKKKRYDIVIRADGDSQHDVTFIKNLVEPVLKDKADIAIGSRFIPPFTGYRSSLIRRLGITFFSKLISFLTISKVTDPTSGFRAYSKKAIDVFSVNYPHDFPEPEEIMMAKRFKMRVIEVPVAMRKRPHGVSSIRYATTLYYMVKVTFAILLDTLKCAEK